MLTKFHQLYEERSWSTTSKWSWWIYMPQTETKWLLFTDNSMLFHKGKVKKKYLCRWIIVFKLKTTTKFFHFCLTIQRYKCFISKTSCVGHDISSEGKERPNGWVETAMRVLIEQQRQRDLGRGWWIYCSVGTHNGGDVRGRKRGWGWRRRKSGRLDFESTHRRILFNVSLTFLLSVSSRQPSITGAEWAERKSREERWGGDWLRRCNDLPGFQSRSQDLDKVMGQGSWEGQQIKRRSSLAWIRFHCQGVLLMILSSPCAAFLAIFLLPGLYPFNFAVFLLISLHTTLSSLYAYCPC